MRKKIPEKLEGFDPFGELIGLSFSKLEDGHSQCIINADKKLMNPHKVLHGGVLYSMADTGMGAAVYTQLNEDELCSTIEIKIGYYEIVTSGSLVCDTRIIHKGKRIVSLESEIRNDGKLVAKAVGTYYIFKPSKNA